MMDGPGSFRRILVTGGAGFIGGHLVAALLARGAEVTVVDDFSTGAAANLPDHASLRVIQGSVTDPAAMAGVGPVDLVFHLAAVVGMRLVAADRGWAYQVAVRGTRNVLAATGNTPIVIASSSAVYGLQREGRASERMRPSAARLLEYDGGVRGYACGKWAAEQLGRRAARAGRPVLIVRPFNVVGPAQSGEHGMVVPTFIDRAARGLPLTVFSPGTQTRCFTGVEAFVGCILRLVDTCRAWTVPNRVVNVGTGTPTSIARLARIVVEETGSASPIHVVPYESRFPGRHDVLRRVPDLRRLGGLVGAWEWPHIREIVQRCVGAVPAGRA
jgi:UDP-glucose 4-epimerase